MRISDWSSDVCSSDLLLHEGRPAPAVHRVRQDALEIVACVDGLARSRLLVALVDRLRLDKIAGQRVLGPVAATLQRQCAANGQAGRLVAGRMVGVIEAEPKGYGLVSAVANIEAEHTSELQSLMRISYAVFCLKNKPQSTNYH